MTSKILAALGLSAVVLLSGCEGVGKPSKTLEAALDAYVAGDRAALSSVAETVEAEKAAAVALPEWDTSCAAEAVAARRTLLTAAFVDSLDQQTVMSMPELARLANLEAVAQGQGKLDLDDVPPSPDCGKRNQIGVVRDAAEKLLMIKTVAGRGKAWREAMQTKYGAEFEPRMKEAVHLLRRHGYRTNESYL
jgi:hypothetical protein